MKGFNPIILERGPEGPVLSRINSRVFYCDHGPGEHLEIGVFVASGKFIPWNQVDGASQKAFHQDGSTQAEREIHIQ